MPILCSQKPPVTCHVTQDDSRCPSRTHTSWSSVVSDLVSYCLLPPSALDILLFGYSGQAPSSGHLLSLPGMLFSRYPRGSLPYLLQWALSGPPNPKLPHGTLRPPFPPSLLHFSPWTSLLANILHNSLICFIICILSLPCELQKGKHVCLFCFVMC